ncbi:MAG TPA: V-type ATPase subunit, partial [Micromonosporaceae bacterium]
MTSAARYSTAYARMHALKSRLWTPLDRPLLAVAGITPGGRAVTADPEAVWPDLVRWYSVLIATYRSAAPLLEALIRRHEVENLKLLWRAAVRRRVPPHRSWRPLGLLGVITFSTRLSSPEELVHRLDSTPYSSVARTLLRTHGTDLPATEIGLDRWVWNRVWTEAERLPRAECDAVRLVRLLVMDSDVEL